MPKYDMLLPKIEFLEKDFITLSEQLKENYNPSNITALANVGTVLMAMKKLEHEIDKEEEIIHNEIHDELMGAEKYYEKWIEEKDPNYKQMAKDELRHSMILWNQARMIAKDPIEQSKIQSYKDWHDTLLNNLS